MRFVGVVLAVVTAACLDTGSVPCADGRTCPQGTVCAELTGTALEPELCVAPGALTACATAAADFADCDLGGGTIGACYASDVGRVCLPSGCGNGIGDPAEACDDANAIAGDGCSNSCMSTEVCGNAFVDSITREHCDDGNTLSHDGCRYDCFETESAQWTQISLAAPTPRMEVLMAYDTARARVLMFGGEDGTSSTSNHFDETWQFDGDAWTKVTSLAGPSARIGASMVYDPSRGRIVLFGGFIRSAGTGFQYDFFDDTWEWDGTSWSLIATPVHPGVRAGGGMAFDPIRKRVVLYGGLYIAGNDATLYDDTWEFDGATWTQRTVTGPPARYLPAMGIEPKTGAMLMFGGSVALVPNEVPVAETWRLDGSGWTQLSPSTSPPPRFGATLAFDAKTQRLLLLAGQAGTVTADDIWSWTGQTWEPAGFTTPATSYFAGYASDPKGRVVMFGGRLASGQSADTYALHDNNTWAKLTQQAPPPLRGHAMTFDSLRGRAIMFGGATDTSSAPDGDDVWELQDRTWTLVPGTGTPSARHRAALAFDEKRAKTVMFGGCTGLACTELDDTWLWNGAAWTPGAAGPPARAQHAMAYDAARGRVVMFGGGLFGQTVRSDLWEWDGTSWSQKLQAAGVEWPDARYGHAMAYDPIRRVVVLFGGVANGKRANDTWLWDGTNWKRLTSIVAPQARAFAAMAWNPDRRRMVLYGGDDSGVTATRDTWELDGEEWSALALAEHPAARTEATLAPSSDGIGLILFGGAEQSSNDPAVSATYGDEWLLTWGSTRHDDACRDQSDSDRDLLAGCSDPDCWTRCTPTCSPGTTCDTSAPRCGDGICNAALETCHSCPGDCTCMAVCGDNVCDSAETAASCPGDCTP